MCCIPYLQLMVLFEIVASIKSFCFFKLFIIVLIISFILIEVGIEGCTTSLMTQTICSVIQLISNLNTLQNHPRYVPGPNNSGFNYHVTSGNPRSYIGSTNGLPDQHAGRNATYQAQHPLLIPQRQFHQSITIPANHLLISIINPLVLTECSYQKVLI